jgi:hypothetical protein
MPPRPSSAETVSATEPSSCGAVHVVCACVASATAPAGALQRYVSASPSGSVATAVMRVVCPRSTVHGRHAAVTVGGRLRVGCGPGGWAEAIAAYASDASDSRVTQRIRRGALTTLVIAVIAPPPTIPTDS